MASLEQVQAANPQIKIKSIFDDGFKQFGQIIEFNQQNQLLGLLDETEIPLENNIYIRDVQSWLEEQRIKIEQEFYGETAIEIGYCNGHSNHLNAFEFHNSSEINVAGTDLILFMAHRSSIQNQWVDTDEAEAFFIPQGTAIEVYATTLHFAPCAINDEGFRCVVILPAGTNGPLKNRELNSIVFQKNKWLLTHAENTRMVKNGARVGVRGINYAINKIKKDEKSL